MSRLIARFGCFFKRGANTCPRGWEICVVKCCDAELGQGAVLPFLVSKLASKRRNSLPVAAHCAGIHFGIDVTLYDQAEHPQFSVGLEQWIILEFVCKLVRNCWQSLLAALDIGSDRPEVSIQGVAAVTCVAEPLFCLGECGRCIRPVVEIGEMERAVEQFLGFLELCVRGLAAQYQ
ncbi:MAG TPA: hypothetical protein VKX49_16445 [Bryobacteraceae bacterium]|nr:hypothetical protein [Bryobacteraceae bacterium]